MRLGDFDALKEEINRKVRENQVGVFDAKRIFDIIDNAPTVAFPFEICGNTCQIERPQGEWITIDDVMSVFDDFMRGDISENDTEEFLEMLKDKIEQRGDEE